MKIGFVYDVIYPYTIGGIEKRIYETGRRLAARGHEVHVFGMKSWDGPDIIERDGLIIHGAGKKQPLYVNGRRSILQTLRFTVQIVPVLLRFECDILDIESFPYFPGLFSPLYRNARKKVFTWQEFWGTYWCSYLSYAGIFGIAVEKLLLSISNPLIAGSRHTKSALVNAGYSKEITVIPSGLDYRTISEITPSTEEYDIIFAGRFIPEKHPELVVLAVSHLIKEKPDINCLLVGDGPEYESVLALIRSLNLESNVKAPGFLQKPEDLYSFLKASKIFVLPSEREGFGIVAVEAIACGCMFITLNHPRNAAVDHVIKNSGMTSSSDPKDLSDCILKCLNSTPDKDLMKEYAMAHDWDTITDAVEEYYNGLLDEDDGIKV